MYTNAIDPWLLKDRFRGEWRGQKGRGKLSHNAAACKASIIMLSATSRVALLSIARNTRLRTTILASRSIRPCQFTTTAHRCDALPLSDAQRKTIYALSTPPGKSGVAIIRVSGPEALSVWKRMVVRSTRGARLGRDKGSPHLPEPWKLERCHILDPHTSEVLDEALVVFFRGAPAHRNNPLPSLFPLTGRD